jgi:hypothetical protein
MANGKFFLDIRTPFSYTHLTQKRVLIKIFSFSILEISAFHSSVIELNPKSGKHAMSDVAFLQFLKSNYTPGDSLKDFCKRTVVGGTSITGATLESALGRPMLNVWTDRLPAHAKFEIAAISFNTPGAPRAYCEALRLKALGKIVIAGGAHPSALPDEALKYFDAICIGAGDAQFPRMVTDAKRGKLKHMYHGNPGDWAIPRRHRTLGLSLVQLSRGCSKSCSFCSVSAIFPGGVDEKPLELVARELKQTPGTLSIIDDNFPVNTAKGQQVLALLRDAGKRFLCQVSPETALDQKVLKDLARSGCILVGVGMESINPQSLAFLGKPLQKDFSKVVERIQDAGMACYLNLVFGSDGETSDIFEETLQFLEQTRPAVVSPHILTPYPGTVLYTSIAQQDRLLFKESGFPEAWAFFDSKHVTFVPDPMTPDELREGFAMFVKELFSLRKTLQRAPRKFFWTALLSSLLKNAW